jgi:MFS transporter, DHA3 family, macrolide efflux protein
MIHENVFEPGSKKWTGPFFTIWIGQAFSLVGSQLVQFAIIWWLTTTTKSATMLAFASLVGLVPQVLLGPFAGTLVDRWNRRLILIVADLVSALAALALVFLFWRGNVQIWHVFLVIFIRSLAGGFQWPAMQASVTLMVPKDYYTRVQGMNQAMSGLMTILAAPAGALLLAILPMYGILSIDVITALLAVIPLLFIRIPQPVRQTATSTEIVEVKPTIWQDFKAGLHYVFGWPGLVMIVLIATLINLLLAPTSTLLPILVTKVFLGQAIQLAWLQSAFGVGTIVGGIVLGVWGGFHRRILTSLAGVVAMGIFTLLLGLVPVTYFLVAVGLGFLIGFTSPIINGPLFAVVQGAVDPQMQGRVFTLITSLAAAMAPIGLIVAGPLADLFGVRTWYIIGGIATALLGMVAFTIPAVMHVEDGRTPKLPENEPAALTPGE